MIIGAKTKEQEQIRKQIGVYQERIQSSPAVEQQYKELTRGYQTVQQSFDDLQKKRDNSEMAVNLERKQQGEQFSVLDPANLPDVYKRQLLQRRNPGTHYLRQKCASQKAGCLNLNSGIVDEAREALLQTTIPLRSILWRCNFLLGPSIARGFFGFLPPGCNWD